VKYNKLDQVLLDKINKDILIDEVDIILFDTHRPAAFKKGRKYVCL